MIKALIDAWHSGRVMSRMYGELLDMLEAAQNMFRIVGEVIFDGRDPDEVREEIYQTDRVINRAERRIRKEIVEHLAIHPRGDMPAGLVLMSLLKDAERLGDYCKNLFEIRELAGAAFPMDELARRIRERHAEACALFNKVQSALKDANEDLAHAIMADEKHVAGMIEKSVREVAASDLTARDAVCRALCLRHLKRIHAHLTNITSAVVQPAHRIDFRRKGKLPKADVPEKEQ